MSLAGFLVLLRHIGLRLGEPVGPLLEGWLHEMRRLPEVRCEVLVGMLQGLERRLHEVPLRPRVATGAREAIGDTRKLQHLFQSWGSDDAGTARGWDQTHLYGSS